VTDEAARETRERHYLRYRRRVLPEQLELARRRYRHLLAEAERLGMRHLLTEGER
jgi:hypothetical protein